MNKLLISEIAKKFDCTQVTVLNWIKSGAFPSAKLNVSGIVPYWEIPEKEVLNFKPPIRGRRPANKLNKGEIAA